MRRDDSSMHEGDRWGGGRSARASLIAAATSRFPVSLRAHLVRTVLILWAASHSALADPGVAPDTLVLTMEDALSTALARNVSVRNAEEAVTVQKASRKEAVAAFAPSLSAGGSYSDTWGEEDGALPDGGDAAWAASITASWTIWDGGGRWADLARQSAGLSRAEASFWQTKQSVLRSVIDAYLTLVEASHTQEVAEQSLRLASATLERATGLRDGGRATASDVLRAEVTVAQQRAELVRARNNVQTARRTLSDLLGVPFTIILTVDPDFDPVMLRAAGHPSGATGTLPSVAIAEASVAQARATTLGQKARFLPRLTASATSSWSRHEDSFGEPERRGSLGLSWSLFEGGARVFALEAARASQRSATWDLQDARRQITSDIEQAWADMQAAEAQWEAAKQTLALAEDSYAQENALYDLGRATSLEVLTALDTLNRSRREEVASRYQILRAFAQLRACCGTLNVTMFRGSHLRQEAN